MILMWLEKGVIGPLCPSRVAHMPGTASGERRLSERTGRGDLRHWSSYRPHRWCSMVTHLRSRPSACLGMTCSRRQMEGRGAVDHVCLHRPRCPFVIKPSARRDRPSEGQPQSTSVVTPGAAAAGEPERKHATLRIQRGGNSWSSDDVSCEQDPSADRTAEGMRHHATDPDIDGEHGTGVLCVAFPGRDSGRCGRDEQGAEPRAAEAT